MIRKLIKYKTILFFLLYLHANVQGQGGRVLKINEKEVESKLDTLKIQFGTRKKIPENFRLAFYAAIAYYPELAHTRVKFKSKKLKSTMAARPTVGSMFRSAEKRKYVIFVNTKTKNGNPLYTDFTFNAKVGLIGHELAHILHYTHTSFFKIAGEGIKYRKETFKSKYERATDSLTVARGLGWQVYDFTSQLHVLPNVPESYKEYKKRVYFSPQAILALMSDLGYEF